MFEELNKASMLQNASENQDFYSEMIIDDIEDQSEEQEQTVVEKK